MVEIFLRHSFPILSSLNRQFQCKSKKIYQAQTPQNLTLTKILQKFRKTSSTPEAGECSQPHTKLNGKYVTLFF